MYSFPNLEPIRCSMSGLLLDLHTDFSGGRQGSLILPSLEEFSSLLWSTQSKALVSSIKQKQGSHRVGHDWSDLAAVAAHSRKITLKILQARLQQYVNWEIPDVQVGFRKGRGTRDQIASVHWIIEAREFQKNICFVDYTKACDYVDHNKLENS